MRSLESCYRDRDNTLGFLRLVFASMVVLTHAWPASGHGQDPLSRLTEGRWNIGTIGLIGFFVMSGFLITQSAQRLSIPRYAWHRVLRIFPAFLVCIVFTAFVLAPALWLYEYHGISGFFSHPAGPVDYVTKNARLGIQQWGVSGLPINTPENKVAGGPIFDAPLWTLQYEFLLYGAVAALAVVGLKRRAAWMLPPLLLGTWLYTEVIAHSGRTVNDSFYGPMPVLGGWINLVYVGGLALMFVIGATMAAHAKRVPVSDTLALACAVTCAVSVVLDGPQFLNFATLGYVVLWGGVRLPLPRRVFGMHRDYSYGIYIYAFLFQQALTEIGVRNFAVHLAATFALTVPLAMLSWHFIEKRALSLKGIKVGRRTAPVPADAPTASP